MVLIRLLLYVFMFVGAYMLLRKLLSPAARTAQTATEPPRPVSQLVQDPQCGVYLDVNDAVQRTVGNGKVFFCSESCANAWMTKKRA
jgi:YHS domain-containing protein